MSDSSLDQEIVNQIIFDYIKCPIHRDTFRIRPIKNWVEKHCEGHTLNLFASKTKLLINEVRNDLDPKALADFNKEALAFVKEWKGNLFDVILLDPPYSYRKSMELYGGRKASRFRQLKDALPRILKPGGKVITFGYHSCSMGKQRGFVIERICLFSHGGATHDTIATIEKYDISH